MIYENTKNQSNMKKLKVLFTVLCVLCLIVNNANVYGETISVSSFSSINGNLDNAKIVSYSAYKGGGTSAPAINSNAIRLYQNSSGSTGGYIVISVPDGYKITSATIGSSMATTTGYYINSKPDGTSTPAKKDFVISNQSLSANSKYEVTGLNTQYITFACFGTSSSSRLYCNYLSVTYSSSGSTETTPSITQQPNNATYDQGAKAAALTITASGNPTPTYQWYSNTSKDNSNGTAISGATEASYTPSTATAGTFYYYCVATNSKGSATSDVATIKVNAAQTYTVLWSLGGDEYAEGNPTTSVKSGERVTTLPTPPDGNAIGSCANTFMGWSTHDLGTKKGQSAPTDLFTTAEGSPVITQDTIFYAVFATGPTE